MCLGIPGEVLSVAEDPLGTGCVRFGEIVKEVCFVYVPEVAVGEFVVVHAGFAISRLERERAGKVFACLESIDELRGACPRE